MEDFLRAMKMFKDEVDQEYDDQHKTKFKYANEQISPSRWDSLTIVHEIFRIVQDLTNYNVQSIFARGEINQMIDLSKNMALGVKPGSELLANQIVNNYKGPVSFLSNNT